MSRIAFSYEIPFVEQVTMPERWARWLAAQSSKPNTEIGQALAVDGTITWRYRQHAHYPPHHHCRYVQFDAILTFYVI
jgi:hypothetical protein